jgi:hypothetical protein
MIRTVSLGWCVVFAAAACADDPAKDAQRKAVLAKAAAILVQTQEAEKEKNAEQVKTRYAGFVTTLQGVAGQFHECTPEEAAKPKTFQKVTLNADGQKLDAIRFKTPAGKANFDLNWEFVSPKDGGVKGWNIIAREGEVDGFKTFATKANFSEKGVDLPKENKQFTQKLAGGKLKPETEYVIWFTFDTDKPADVHIRLALTPVK